MKGAPRVETDEAASEHRRPGSERPRARAAPSLALGQHYQPVLLAEFPFVAVSGRVERER